MVPSVVDFFLYTVKMCCAYWFNKDPSGPKLGGRKLGRTCRHRESIGMKEGGVTRRCGEKEEEHAESGWI